LGESWASLVGLLVRIEFTPYREKGNRTMAFLCFNGRYLTKKRRGNSGGAERKEMNVGTAYLRSENVREG